MASKRLDRLKQARSISDIMDVVSEIAYELKNRAAIVKRIVTSLSNELVFDVREGNKNKGKGVNVTDTTYVAPKLADLKKHTDVINKLYENAVELSSAEALVKQSFAGNRKQAEALRAIKELRKEVDDAIADAFAALEAVANKHIPSKMSRLIDVVTGHIIDVLPVKSYKNIQRRGAVVPDPDNNSLLHFCEYIEIEGLQNLQGYTYDEYIIVVTAVVDQKGNMTFHINGLPDFKIPGRYPLGTEVVDANGAKKRINMLLDHNNFVVDFEKQPMELTTERAGNTGITRLRGVTGARVENDELIVFIDDTVSERSAQNLIPEIMARLNSVMGLKKRDQLFQYKLVKRGGKKAIKFIIVPNVGKKMTFSLERLREVSELLGLTEKQQAALRFALQH